MSNGIIDLNILPLETLAEMANDAAEQSEKNAKLTVQKAIDAGRYLTAAKEQVEHGQWLAWLGKNWNYKQRYAQSCMSLSNAQHVAHLGQAANWREALRMIADERAESEPEIAPRSERRTGQVEVIEPEQVGQTDVQVDDDTTPDPPTIRKTAKGSEKVSEDKKPRTETITPEILPDEPEAEQQKHWPEVSLEELIEGVIAKLDHEKQRKAAAKTLRKLADKLDPPDESKPSKIPPASELRAFVDGDTMAEETVLVVNDWIAYKQRHPDKKSRYQSVDSFRKDLKRMLAEMTKQGESVVREAIEKAEAKGWRGWEHDSTTTGKVNGNGSANRGTGKRGYTADEVFS